MPPLLQDKEPIVVETGVEIVPLIDKRIILACTAATGLLSYNPKNVGSRSIDFHLRRLLSLR